MVTLHPRHQAYLDDQMDAAKGRQDGRNAVNATLATGGKTKTLREQAMSRANQANPYSRGWSTSVLCALKLADAKAELQAMDIRLFLQDIEEELRIPTGRTTPLGPTREEAIAGLGLLFG